MPLLTPAFLLFFFLLLQLPVIRCCALHSARSLSGCNLFQDLGSALDTAITYFFLGSYYNP